MTQDLHERSHSRCELCSGNEDLNPYLVEPKPEPSADIRVLLCKTCRDHLQTPTALDIKHWYGLNESIWSEPAAVKVLAYRILKGLPGNPWAQDLLNQIYLDDEQQGWADAGVVVHERTETQAPVLDSNGTQLQEGDTVTLIKDLDVKGANFTAKRGTTVKNISLTDDPKYIEGRINGTRIVLVAAYLKKA